jgi:hypothetical protein
MGKPYKHALEWNARPLEKFFRGTLAAAPANTYESANLQ